MGTPAGERHTGNLSGLHEMIRQCLIIFGCLAFGELVVWLTGITIPSSIIGMLLLTLLLQTKIIKEEWVKSVSDFLISNLGFFFVPPGVALMLYFDVIKAEFLPIVAATVASTIIVLIVTGWTHQIFKSNGDTTE
jgi:holin-like protein